MPYCYTIVITTYSTAIAELGIRVEVELTRLQRNPKLKGSVGLLTSELN